MARSENNLIAVFTDTANAIRSKKSSSAEISPRDFADEIMSIPSGVEPTGTKNIYTNGNNIDVKNFAYVNVEVPTEQRISYEHGDSFLNSVYHDEEYADAADDVQYLAIQEYDGASLRLSMSFTWNSETWDKSYIVPGYHVIDSNGMIVVGVLGMPESDSREWDIELNIEYKAYTGSYSEDELADHWNEIISGISVVDLNGSEIGKVTSLNVTVTCESES